MMPRTPDDIVAVLGFDPADDSELTEENDTRSQRALDNVTEEAQPARKPTALKKTPKRKSSVRKVKK